jgi:hypothetical protein
VSAVVVAYFVQAPPPPPLPEPPVNQRSIHEASAVGIAAASRSVVDVHDEGIFDEIFIRHGDGIPAMIATTTTAATATSTNNNNNNNNNNTSTPHQAGGFGDYISARGITLFGLCNRYPLYLSGKEKNDDDTGSLGHYAAASHLYKSIHGPFSSRNLIHNEECLIDNGTVVADNDGSADARRCDGDSFSGMHHSSTKDFAPRDTAVVDGTTHYINKTNEPKDEDEQEHTDSSCSNSLEQGVGSYDYDADDEKVVKKATTFSSNEGI